MASQENISDLIAFCQTVMKHLSTRLANNCIHLAESLYEKMCLKVLNKMDTKHFHSLPKLEQSHCLETIVKFILELTYIDECQLVEEEFPEGSTTYSRIMFIIDTVSGVENLAQEMLQTKSSLEILGPEILECLHWRKGALLYMYCHTLYSKSELKPFPDHYQKCLETGVEHLKSFLCTRRKPNWLKQLDGESQPSDSDEDDKQFLLSEGLYSDIHLLGLMYCGELCYWLIQHILSLDDKSVSEQCQETENTISNNSQSHQPSHTEENINKWTQTCLSCLKVYIKSATGPMSPGEWSTSRAEEIIHYLN
ncbi:hypothetical protein Btru_069471 [Bulinus truncatus]|nr:hypothetical protein Btru_069471 [Bulinus truncatus]